MAKYQGNSLRVGISASTDLGSMDSDTLLTANVVKSVEITNTADTYESTGAGDTAKTYLAGHLDANVKIDCWDPTVSSDLRGQWGSLAASDLVVIWPQGTTTGTPVFYFSGIVTSTTLGVAHDGVTPFTIAIQSMGSITETTAS